MRVALGPVYTGIASRDKQVKVMFCRVRYRITHMPNVFNVLFVTPDCNVREMCAFCGPIFATRHFIFWLMK